MYSLMHELLFRDSRISQNRLALIPACERNHPHPDRQRFRGVPYERELSRLGDHWLSKVLERVPPVRTGITGLWFGLFNPIRGEVVTDFYVAGSPSYEEDSYGNWASCPEYFPE